MKMFWRQEHQSYLSSNPGKVETRFQFSQLFSKAWLRGMSMSNTFTGFRMTGMYPFDRYALRPQDDKKKSIAEKNGLKFIQCSPPKPHRSHGHPETPTFSEREVLLFQKRLEEGYDIQDERYDLWKPLYHPAEARTASSPVVVTTTSAECSPTALLSSERLSFQEEKKRVRMTPTARKRVRMTPTARNGMRKFLLTRKRVLRGSCNEQQLCRNFCHIQSLQSVEGKWEGQQKLSLPGRLPNRGSTVRGEGKNKSSGKAANPSSHGESSSRGSGVRRDGRNKSALF